MLGRLSPRQNREIPPLRYPMVYRVKQDFPGLEAGEIPPEAFRLERMREALARFQYTLR